jgi:hypothetical protein
MMDPLFPDPPASSPASPSIVPADVRSAARADAPTDRPTDGSSIDRSIETSIVKPVDYDAEARDVIEFAHALFTPVYPTLAQVYTTEAREKIAAAAGPLMRKYSFTLGVIGPELMFVIAVAPLIVPTVQAIKHDRQEQTKTVTPIGEGAAAPRAAAPAVVTATHNADGERSPLAAFPGQAGP